MGDLDHDDLPTQQEQHDNFFPNPSANEEKEEMPEVVLYDNVAVALDDEAWGMAMKSVMAIFIAVAVAIGGVGFLKPRPVLAVEPVNFSTSYDSPTIVVVQSGESSNYIGNTWSSIHSWGME